VAEHQTDDPGAAKEKVHLQDLEPEEDPAGGLQGKITIGVGDVQLRDSCCDNSTPTDGSAEIK
jgi:hypothetical protein